MIDLSREEEHENEFLAIEPPIETATLMTLVLMTLPLAISITFRGES
jgi:hypothetical protein